MLDIRRLPLHINLFTDSFCIRVVSATTHGHWPDSVSSPLEIRRFVSSV